MSPTLFILSTVRNHPIATAATGAVGGIGAWVLTWGEVLSSTFRVVGGFFGCLLAVVSFLFVLPRLLRFCSRWARKGLVNADRDE